MITECYIKGRYDFGVGKCAVVIVEEGEIVYQSGWVVKDSFQYDGSIISPDQFNCEIIAATHAMRWCSENNKNIVNIYANTTSCQKWYYRREFPDGRIISNAFNKYAEGIDVFSEYIAKNDENYFNRLVNSLAEQAKE